MKKILLFLVSLMIGAALFILVAKTVGWQEIKNVLLVFTGWQGILILILTFLIMFVGNWKWKKILEGQEIKLSFWELFKYYLAGFSVMFLAPILFLAGEVFRGYVLKKRKDIPGFKVMTSVFIDKFLEWLSSLIVAFFGVLFFLYAIGVPTQNIVILVGITILISLSFIFLVYSRSSKEKSVVKLFLDTGFLKNFKYRDAALEAERTIFNFFRLKNESLGSVLGLSALRTLIMYFRTWLLILFLGKSIGALPVVTVLGFTYLAVAIPIPAALGSHEALQALGFSALGLGASTATAFTMIIRVAELLFALIGVIILFRLGVILLRELIFEKAEKLGTLIIKNNS